MSFYFFFRILFHKRLRIIILIIFLSTLLINGVAITFLSVKMKDTGLQLNVAGKQRMRIQKMTKETLIISLQGSDEHDKLDLRETITQFETYHTALYFGNLSLNLPEMRDDAKILWVAVDTIWMEFKPLVFESSFEEIQLENIEKIKELTPIFADTMDNLVIFLQDKMDGSHLKLFWFGVMLPVFILIIAALPVILLFELEKKNRSIAASEVRYRNLIQSSPLAITVLQDKSSKLINRAYLKMYGYEKEEEVIGRPDIDFVAIKDREYIENLLRSRLLGYNEPKTYETMAQKQDGTEFPINIRIVHIEFDQKPAYLAYIEDIAVRKATEEDLKQQREEIFQLQKMEALGRLVGGIVHDFKNIMTVISMSADYLKMTFSDQDEIMTEVLEIQESVNMADSITQQLLAFSKEQKSEFFAFNPEEVLSKLQNWLNRLVGTRINFTLNMKNKNLKIFANPSMLKQVLINLITNSRDAMPRGGDIKVTLDKISINNSGYTCDECDVGTECGHNVSYLGKEIKNGDYLNIHVQDNGMGMDEETLKQIFEPFFTTKTPGKGTGLGLSTVYGIINNFSGYIGVASKVNVGTTFHILIPLVQ